MSFHQVRLLLEYLFIIWEKDRHSKIPKTYISFYGGEPLLNMNLIMAVVQYIEHQTISRILFFYDNQCRFIGQVYGLSGGP